MAVRSRHTLRPYIVCRYIFKLVALISLLQEIIDARVIVYLALRLPIVPVDFIIPFDSVRSCIFLAQNCAACICFRSDDVSLYFIRCRHLMWSTQHHTIFIRLSIYIATNNTVHEYIVHSTHLHTHLRKWMRRVIQSLFVYESSSHRKMRLNHEGCF